MEPSASFVDPSTRSAANAPTVVPLQQFRDAQSDPAVHAMLDYAAAYGEQIEREGRNR
jgi:hypothetical protein